MSETAQPQHLLADPGLIGYVARDGDELGAFTNAEIAERLQRGEFQPNDYYWCEGLRDWVPLGTALEVAPPRTALLTPARHKQLITAAWIIGGFLLALLLAIFFVTRRDGAAPVRPLSVRSDDSMRALGDKAVADLRERISRLPTHAAPPLNAFYTGVSAKFRRSLLPRTTFEGMIEGSANEVDPATQQATRRTDFSLTTGYRDGEWVFLHYRAKMRNLLDDTEIEEEHDGKEPAPPPIVALLGLGLVTTEPGRR